MKIWQPAQLAATALGLIVGGCSASTSTTQPPTAESTVKTYFAAVNAHRWKQAEALLAPSLERTYVGAPDNDSKNTLTATNVKVKVYPAPFERGAYPGYTSIQQALTTFDATYKKVYGSANGPQTRFVYVGHTGVSGPWQILGIGTGP